jgi:hypothetical protein
MEEAGLTPADNVDAIADVVVPYVEWARTAAGGDRSGSGRVH